MSVRGLVRDGLNEIPLRGAHVLLIRTVDSLTVGVIAEPNGAFTFTKVNPGHYTLRISFLGYQSFYKKLQLEKENLDLGDIRLVYTSTHLKEIQVKAKLPAAILKGDTLQFNANAFTIHSDATAEDLLRKLPGMDMNNGALKAHGETVTNLMVDGKPFFGDDPYTALKNLPVEVIDKLQVYDQRSEQSRFTGFDDGQTTKTINIVTRPDKRQGQFGKVFAGYGDENKYQSGGNLNIFRGNRRLSVVAQSSNINFHRFQDPGQFGNGIRGQYRGTGKQAGFASLFAGNPNGMSNTQSAGINYSDKWGNKTEVTGSYFFNRNETLSNQYSFRSYVLPSDSGQVYEENTLSSNVQLNHRVHLRLEHRIDSVNSLLIRPNITFQQSNGTSFLAAHTSGIPALLNQTLNNVSSGLLGYTFSNDALFRHRFVMPHRTFSFNLHTNYHYSKGSHHLEANNIYYHEIPDSSSIHQMADSQKNGWTVSGNAVYTEPLGQRGLLQFNYMASLQLGMAAKNTFNQVAETRQYNSLDSTLTNHFSSQYASQRLGTSYRYQAGAMNFSLGLNYQWAQLQNNQILPSTLQLTRTFQNLLPLAMLQYKLSGNQHINLSYWTATSQPSVDQLQQVINNVNPIQLTYGNPDLKQTYLHNLTLRYSTANVEKSSTGFLFLSGSYAHNYFTNSTFITEKDSVLAGGIVLKSGAQLNRPVNLDGYWSLRSLATYGLPVRLLKSNLNLNASFDYTRSPGLINNRLNYSHTQTLGLGMVLSSSFSDKIDFSLSSNSSLSYSENTLQTRYNTLYLNQNNRLSFNYIFWKGVVVQTSLNHQFNRGLSAGYNRNFFLWNVSIAKKLLKNNRGEIKMAAFDLLHHNNSIQRNVTATYLEDVQTQVLQRYLMITFTYNLRHFD